MFLILLYFDLEVVQFGMFEVQSRKLINSLVERTKLLQKKLTAGILRDHEDINKKSVVSLISAAVPKKKKKNSSAPVGFENDQKQGSISDLKECFSSHRLCNELENILGKMGMPSDMQELMELKVKTELVSRLRLLCLT